MNSLSKSDDAISQALVGARSSATPLHEFPGMAPDTMAHAYAIQALVRIAHSSLAGPSKDETAQLIRDQIERLERSDELV